MLDIWPNELKNLQRFLMKYVGCKHGIPLFIDGLKLLHPGNKECYHQNPGSNLQKDFGSFA